MNLALLQRPKKAKIGKQYIYAPSVLSEGLSLSPGSVVVVCEIHEGPTPQETTLKVIEDDTWREHTVYWCGRSTNNLCTLVRAKRGDYKESERPVCDCEKPIEKMPESLKEGTHFILLSDVGV